MDFDPMADYEIKSRHCMIDLETIDNKPTSAIASIGAVMFDEDGMYSEFYLVVDTESSLKLGLTKSEGTLTWWSKQSEQARSIFDAATPKADIRDALLAFSKWFKDSGGLYLWGNGAAFDNAIMSVAYGLAGLEQPWGYSNDRCFRTIKHKGKMENRQGTYHNALDDAKTQAQYMIDNGLVPPL